MFLNLFLKNHKLLQMIKANTVKMSIKSLLSMLYMCFINLLILFVTREKNVTLLQAICFDFFTEKKKKNLFFPKKVKKYYFREKEIKSQCYKKGWVKQDKPWGLFYSFCWNYFSHILYNGVTSFNRISSLQNTLVSKETFGNSWVQGSKNISPTSLVNVYKLSGDQHKFMC